MQHTRRALGQPKTGGVRGERHWRCWRAWAVAAAALVSAPQLAAQWVTNLMTIQRLDLDRDGVIDFTLTETLESGRGDTRTQPVVHGIWVYRWTTTLAAREGVEFLVGPDPGDPRLGGQPALMLHLGDEIGPNPPAGWQWRALPDPIVARQRDEYSYQPPGEPGGDLFAVYADGAFIHVTYANVMYLGVRLKAAGGWHYGYLTAVDSSAILMSYSSINTGLDTSIRPGELPWIEFVAQPPSVYYIRWSFWARDLGYVLQQTRTLNFPQWVDIPLPVPSYPLLKEVAPAFYRLRKGP